MSEPIDQNKEKVTPAKLRELHTSENTTMGNSVKAEPTHTPLDKETKDTIVPVFLGTSKESHVRNAKLLSFFTAHRVSVNNDDDKEKQDRLKQAYLEFAEKEFPGETEDQLFSRIQNYATFTKEVAEFNYIRHEMMREREWEFKSEIADGVFEHDVQPRFPGTKVKPKTVKERILRNADSLSKRPNSYDVLLRNSFIHLRVSRSDLTSLSRLTKQISKEITGYVRTINGNSLTLARASIYRVIWKHLAKRIVKHSVSDIDDPEQLAALIKLSDFRALVTQMIAEVSDDGIPYRLYCGNSECNWTRDVVLSPMELLHHDKSFYTPEQLAVLGSLKNHASTYSTEEVFALQKGLKFVEDNEVSFDNNSQTLIMGEPSLADYFTCFDIYMDRIGDEIRALRADYHDDEQFNVQLNTLIDSVRGGELMHWVIGHKVLAEPGSEEEDLITYAEENPVDFYDGIYELTQSREKLSVALIRWVMTNGPAMTATTVGISNSTCPKCGKRHGEQVTRGVTPIDPITSFFTHVQLTSLDRILHQSLAELNPLS